MFGLRRLKRRYGRFRYNNQARYPGLLVLLDMLKLPLQLLAVALPLWIAVGIYNAQFSYQAQSEKSASAADASSSVPIDRIASAAVAELDSSTDVLVIGRQVDMGEKAAADSKTTDSAVLAGNASEETSSEPSGLRQFAESLVTSLNPTGASELSDDIASMKVKSTTNTDAEKFPDDRDQSVLSSPDKATEVASVVRQLSGPAQIHADSTSNTNESASAGVTIHGADWLAEQLETSFVIQLESSSNVDLMKVRARSLEAAETLAIYPTTLSADGEVTYGLSYGLYPTLADARQANDALPEDLKRFGTWIRQVNALKRQIDSIDIDTFDN